MRLSKKTNGRGKIEGERGMISFVGREESIP